LFPPAEGPGINPPPTPALVPKKEPPPLLFTVEINGLLRAFELAAKGGLNYRRKRELIIMMMMELDIRLRKEEMKMEQSHVFFVAFIRIIE